MKNRRLIFGSLGLTAVLVGAVALLGDRTTNVNETIFTPRSEMVSQDDAKGSAQWLHQLRQDPRTGEIPYEAYMEAKNAVNLMRQSEDSIGALEWEELGPDNVGGRTRAFLIDRDDADLLYAGGVSGGLFVSTTGGSSWQRVNDFQENLAIVSIAQTKNGDVYYGTGEGMYYSTSGTGTGGIMGGGIFKKEASSTAFTQIASTIPTPNQTGSDWASVGVLITSLDNDDRLWAGTNNGFYISNNGGTSWERIELRSVEGANRTLNQITDGVQDSDGGIWISAGINGFYSPTGLPGTFEEVTVNRNQAANDELPRSIGRMVFAVSPQDPDYVYCVQTTGFGNSNSEFLAAYRTTNGGDTWQQIGQQTASLNPHGRQGGYDNAVTVDAFNKDRIFVGGVNFWQWSQQGGWAQVASGSRGLRAAGLYVHVDHHRFVYDATRPGRVYGLNDGGVFRSINNGATWSEINNGYITTQFYGIGFSRDGKVMGGTQDNGTILIDGEGNTSKTGVRTPGIDFRGATRDGDGGFAEISSFTSDVMVKAMQYGILGRSNNGGESFTEFYNFGRMDRGGDGNRAQDLSSQFAPFVTPFLLWENQFDDNSQDTIVFSASDIVQGIGFGQGRQRFTGTIAKPQATTRLVPNTFTITDGNDTLVGGTDSIISGNGSGSINYSTGEYDITFNKPDGVFTQVTIRVSVAYNQGDTVIVKSRTNEIPIAHVLSKNLGPGASEPILDKVQSMFFVGLNSYVDNQGRDLGGIWMTRKIHDFTTVTPEWINVAHFGGSPGQPPIRTSALAVTPDGDRLFVGTSNGRLYRISGLSQYRDVSNSDVTIFGGNPQTDVEQIGNFGRFVTSVSIDPVNNDRVIVTLGGYGGSNMIRFSQNALSASPTFVNKQGNIPNMPIYSSVFNQHNPSEVIVGTDFGVMSTANINSTNPQWQADNGGFANVPVFMLRQEINPIASNETKTRQTGIVYAGTHGRGIWKTGSLAKDNPLTAKNEPAEFAENEDAFKLYPNPASTQTTVHIELENYSDVNVAVRDLTGRVVRNVTFKAQSAGVHDLEVNLEGLPNGTLIFQVEAEHKVRTSKLIKME